MLTQTTCLITYTLPYLDWAKYQDNLKYNPVENIVLALVVDGQTRLQQQVRLTKIDFDEAEMTFHFEGTYNEEAITGWVRFHKITHRFETGRILFG